MDSNPLHPQEMWVKMANQAMPKSRVHFESRKNSGRIWEFLIIYQNHNMCFQCKNWVGKSYLCLREVGAGSGDPSLESCLDRCKKAGAGAAESRCKLSGKRREKKTQIKNKNQSKKVRLKKSLIDGFVQVRLLSVFLKKTKKLDFLGTYPGFTLEAFLEPGA